MRDRVESIVHRVAFGLLLLMPLLLGFSRAGADMAVVLIGVFFLTRSALARDWRWLSSPEIKLLLVFWLYATLNAAWLSDHASWQKTLAWGRFLFFFAAVRQWLLTTPDALKRAMQWSLPVIAVLLIDAYVQYITGTSLTGKPMLGERLSGPLSHANIGNLIFKLMLPMAGIMAYTMVISHTAARIHAAFYGLIIAVVALVPLTGERSVTLLMFLAMACVAAAFFVHAPLFRKRVVVGMIGFLLLFGALLSSQEIVQMRAHLLLEQLADFHNMAYGQLFTMASILWSHHPWLGIGIGQFEEKCHAALAMYNMHECQPHPHNLYLQILSESGLIGFTLFVAAMVLIAKRALVGAPFLLATFAAATFAVLLWPVIGTQSFFANWPAMLFWYTLAMAACLKHAERRT